MAIERSTFRVVRDKKQQVYWVEYIVLNPDSSIKYLARMPPFQIKETMKKMEQAEAEGFKPVRPDFVKKD